MTKTETQTERQRNTERFQEIRTASERERTKGEINNENINEEIYGKKIFLSKYSNNNMSVIKKMAVM